MTKREARYMAEIRKAEGCAYQLPEDGLAPIGSAADVPGSVQRITVDAEGFWRAVMDAHPADARGPRVSDTRGKFTNTVPSVPLLAPSDPPDWLERAIAKDRADRDARDCEDGLIRGEDEPGEDELINR